MTIKEEIIEQLDSLPVESQQRVLNFARSLTTTLPEGTPGEELLKFVGMIPGEDLDLMAKAIEENCEQIDADAW